LPNVIDLFAGAGGLSLGAARAGFNVAAAVELDSHAMATHINNFPLTTHIPMDILTLDADHLLDLSNISQNNLTGIIGGPPCQGFSNIGQGNVNDSRNQLFIKFFKLVNELRPIFFLAENVPGILNDKYSAIRKEAFSYVHDYHLLPPLKINASDYGAPTTRTRIFFIGYRSCNQILDLCEKDFLEAKVHPSQKTLVYQALEGLPANIHYSAKSNGLKKLLPEYCDPNSNHLQSEHFYQHVIGLQPYGIGNQTYINLYQKRHIVNGCFPTKHSAKVRTRYSKLAYGQQDTISKSPKLNPYGFCPTLRAGTGPDKGSFQAVRPIHYAYPRVITPREAARLQGFPDWYQLPDTIWHSFRQLGNSVSPIVAEKILTVIFQKLT
jgi:DNA (cytosine-5)-methyltransferase 1